MILRLCLKDKNSVLIEGDIQEINHSLNNNQFVLVINNRTKKEELYNKDHIWCIRISSQNNI